jgi:hypothetical protein
MSNGELIALADELEHNSFWQGEEIIQRAINTFIEKYWRQPYPALGSFTYPRAESDLHGQEPQPYLAATVYRNIHVRVPDAINEREARLFAEIQIREQLDPTFDPTED